MRVGPAFLQTFASQVVQSAASIATGVLIARALGPVGQGRYALFAAAIGLLSTVGAAGQFEGHVQTSAGDASKGRVLLVRSMLQAVAGLAVIVLTQTLWKRALGLHHENVLVGLLVLVLLCEVVALLFRGINLGQHNITAYNVSTLVQRLSYLGILVVMAVTRGLRVETVMLAWLGAVFANLALSGAWIWKHSLIAPLSWTSILDGWAGSLAGGFRALLTISLTLLLVRADVYMLGPMLGTPAVGQISVASALAEYLWYVPSILGSVLFAAVAANRGRDTVVKICRASRTTIALLAPITLGLAFIGRALVPFIYGHAYVQAGTLFVLLLPGMFAISLHLVIDAYFAGSGFPPITYTAAVCALILKVVLNLVIVPRFGIEGAAVATSVVYASLLLAKVQAFRVETQAPLGYIFSPTWSDLAYNVNVARSWIRRLGQTTVDAKR
jgi:O-antigen/teichoic acid export membrane protein